VVPNLAVGYARSTAIVLGNYDVPAATTLFDGLLEFLARQ